MSRVLVIELPDTGETDLDFSQAMHAVQEAIGSRLSGARVFGAVAGDAEAVLQVFEAAEAKQHAARAAEEQS
jgi:hypothetical protein